jgi:hypothetical protein
MEMDSLITTVQGKPITVQDVVVYLKNKGLFRAAVYELIEKHFVEIICENLDIKLSDEDYYRLRERKKEMMGLGDPITFNEYLNKNGVKYEEFNSFIMTSILKDLLRDQVIPNQQVDEYMEKNRINLLAVSLARIVCRRKEEIEKIKEEILPDSSNFFDLAREYSLEDNAKFTGGYLGDIRRGMMIPDVEAAVFAATRDQVVGPLSEAGFWTLYKVCAVYNTEPTEVLRYKVRDQLFNDWLRREVNAVLA